MIAIAGF